MKTGIRYFPKDRVMSMTVQRWNIRAKTCFCTQTPALNTSACQSLWIIHHKNYLWASCMLNCARQMNEKHFNLCSTGILHFLIHFVHTFKTLFGMCDWPSGKGMCKKKAGYVESIGTFQTHCVASSLSRIPFSKTPIWLILLTLIWHCFLTMKVTLVYLSNCMPWNLQALFKKL